MRSLCFGAIIALLSTSAFAATRTWTGTTSGAWSVASNWGGVAPNAGDDLVFPASGANQVTTNDFPLGFLFHSITISGGSYTLGGNGIELSTGGVNVTGGTTETITLPIMLIGSQTWTFTTGDTLLGPIDLNGAALTITGGSTGGITIAGPVSGSGSIAVTQDTLVDFTGVNTTPAPIATSGGFGAFLGFENNSVYPGSITAAGSGAVAIGKGASVGDVTINGPFGAFIGGISSAGPPSGTANTKNLTFRNATLYAEEITSATDFSQVSVTGTVDLTGAILSIQETSPVPIGTQFTIIRNDGTDPIVGTFIGSPQGGTVTMPVSGGSQNFTIDYKGGDGNDVVITAQGTITTDTTTTVNTTAPPQVGQPVTMTATVAPTTGTAIPTGTVSFLAVTFSGPNPVATVLGTATLDSSGVATLTATLPATTSLIAAFYSGGGVFAGSEGELPVVLAGSIPTLDPRVLVLLAIALAAIGTFALKR